MAHEDELSWAQASTKGDNESLDTYLTMHPNGAHRVDAFRARDRNEERDIEESEDIDRAKARASRADATESKRALLARLELGRALRALDMNALKTMGKEKSTEPTVEAVHEQAQTFVQSVERHPFLTRK